MVIVKRILIVLLLLFAGLQFFRPGKNLSESPATSDISTAFTISPEVQQILAVACNDCHTNNTRYPWYAEIQPVGWFLNNHIVEGKKRLNFSEFASYAPRRQYHKLEEIAEQVESGEMPFPVYLVTHADARLTESQKKAISAFVQDARASMETRYPVDSLVSRRR